MSKPMGRPAEITITITADYQGYFIKAENSYYHRAFKLDKNEQAILRAETAKAIKPILKKHSIMKLLNVVVDHT